MTAHFNKVVVAGHRLNATPPPLVGAAGEQGVKGKSARNLQGRQDSFCGVTTICVKTVQYHNKMNVLVLNVVL